MLINVDYLPFLLISWEDALNLPQQVAVKFQMVTRTAASLFDS